MVSSTVVSCQLFLFDDRVQSSIWMELGSVRNDVLCFAFSSLMLGDSITPVEFYCSSTEVLQNGLFIDVSIDTSQIVKSIDLRSRIMDDFSVNALNIA